MADRNLSKKHISRDSRVNKTFEKLRQAFVVFLQKNDLDALNVQKLTDLAHITRGTFYLHFSDKADFMQQMQTQILNDFFNHTIHYLESSKTVQNFPVLDVDAVFEYTFSHAAIFNILLNQQRQLSFADELETRLMGYMREYMQINEHLGVFDQNIPIKLIIDFYNSALLGFLKDWLRTHQIYSANFMSQIFIDLIQQTSDNGSGIKDFYYFVEKD
ncbi:TetR/AcrR family transcriptional regulator [Agrilactobacillus fermenti]|uniref:TetR/AcrR family transcriptional regulator n=1 Tax=Agrilactobacillus fermenti TaxID=2586909 RepID=UPI001E338D1E|nr:TetR/AcrR family transcriptional regulator [Agrilactobacillus fermenti]MCD2256200.1 TetR/AcrR family transcriptional regulator [Agrilactobacillus fermenti]